MVKVRRPLYPSICLIIDMIDDNADEWEYYIVHDNIGVSHVVRTKRGRPPMIRCVGCDD